ncbi:orexigenic neuropeptide QRFP [Bombina bombina]|uniref:orexigenic neuropeptide QRFP n=1 Tax=Bombina bombina TaxID=8345 RepID=UPI00235A84E8|nr:orexigenic neuropeptide QRFP [Bombina bombina]
MVQLNHLKQTISCYKHRGAEGYSRQLCKMKGAYGLSMLVLLACVSSFPLPENHEQKDLLEINSLWKMLSNAEEDGGASALLYLESLRNKKNADPASLFSVAKELQGFGKERAGFRFRFGRGEGNNEVEDLEPQEEKRSGNPLGSLAEELNGYNRKKGGFSFRFGRR